MVGDGDDPDKINGFQVNEIERKPGKNQAAGSMQVPGIALRRFSDATHDQIHLVAERLGR